MLDPSDGELGDDLHSSLESRSVLVDSSQLDPSGKSCDKIGVTSKAVLNSGDRCDSNTGCPSNQITQLRNSNSLRVMLPNSRIGGAKQHRTLHRPGFAPSALQIYLLSTGMCCISCVTSTCRYKLDLTTENLHIPIVGTQ